jgi:hypothetical protein
MKNEKASRSSTWIVQLRLHVQPSLPGHTRPWFVSSPQYPPTNREANGPGLWLFETSGHACNSTKQFRQRALKGAGRIYSLNRAAEGVLVIS